VPDDWTEVSVTGGVQPAGFNFPGLVYDSATHKILMYGGMDGTLSVSYNQTWAYDVPSRTWTQKALTTTPPPPYNGGFTAQPAMAYDSANHTLYYHQTSNTAAPADWQYNPTADTWTKVLAAGGGAAIDQDLTYDGSNNRLVGWSRNMATFLPDVWQAALSSTVALPTPGVGTGPAVNLVLVSGNGQTGTAGQPLASPFTVQVTDAGGNPVSGVTVTFVVTAGGGTLSAGQVVTNAAGMASSTLTLGAAAGLNTVTAASGTLTGSPVTFTATTATGPAVTGPPAKLVLISGNGQSGTVGQPLASPFRVQVTDVNNNPLSGVSVTFTVSSGGGSLSATQVTTDSSGNASSTLTLGAAGTNTVTAASGALTGSPITFTATGMTGVAFSPCDLNKDGVIDTLDVQLAINQALDVTACSNADLEGDGLCTIVAVQRIVNAVLTGVCKAGP
jgi:hypothetical protein